MIENNVSRLFFGFFDISTDFFYLVRVAIKTRMNVAFYLPKNTKCVSHIKDLKLRCPVFYDKFTGQRIRGLVDLYI